MGFFTVNTNDEAIRDYSGDSSYINKSGIYEVTLKSVCVETSPNGSTYLNFWLEYAGKEQPIFQAIRLTNTDGSSNVGQNLFNKLCVIVGATNGAEIADPVSRDVPIGKNGEMKECSVLEDFDDLTFYMRVQMEYSMYEDKIQERKTIRNFFRFEDKATAAEIVNDTEKGKQFAIEEEKYADKVTYKNGLTEEDVIAWRKERQTKRNNGGTQSQEKTAPKRRFGKSA